MSGAAVSFEEVPAVTGTITTNPFSPVLAKTAPVVLVVSPSLNIDGRKAYSTRGQLFDGKVDGRTKRLDALRACLAAICPTAAARNGAAAAAGVG